MDVFLRSEKLLVESRDLFKVFPFKFGQVAKVTRSTDKETGKRKRFAFVEFNDYDPVDKCIIKVILSLRLY